MMKNSIYYLPVFLFFAFCNGQNQKADQTAEQTTPLLKGDTVNEIGNDIRCIFQDAENNVWFATNGEGVFKYTIPDSAGKRTILQYTDKHGLPGNCVWNVQEGKDGNIWFKTNVRKGTGEAIVLCCFDGRKFTIVPADESTPATTTYNYLEDERLFEYYYREKSLMKIQLPHTSPLEDKKNSRFQYDIYSTYRDNKGNLWLGTCTAGVCIYDGTSYAWLDHKELGTPVRSIFEDKKGIIWIGTNGSGLLRYDPSSKALTSFTKERKANYLDRVWTITDDRQGNLWIGTIDAGVWMFDGKTLANYTTKDGLGSDFIWTIYKDKQDQLWFGTDGLGIYTYDGAKFRSFTK